MDSNEIYDVIVLGTGIAGLATALAAATNRLRVLVIEKAEEIGGGTTEVLRALVGWQQSSVPARRL